MLLSYHNDPKVKQFYLDRITHHEIADEIVQGQYWEDGKGCAVGCLIHGSNHAKFPTVEGPGWPEWLAQLCDALFEGLPNDKAKLFPRRVVEAIPIGANLEPVKWRFAVMLMEENIERVRQLEISDAIKKQVIDAIEQVINANRVAIETGVIDESAWSAARSAAGSAAWSAARSAARSAAGSAAWSAARSAAESAWSAARSAAESAAGSAAWSAAESAAWSAAESAAYIRYVDSLIAMLSEARP